MTSQVEIIKLLTPYTMAFPNTKQMNEGVLLVYSKALSPLSLAQIEAAMLKIIRQSRFWPSVAEIFEAAETMTDFANDRHVPTAAEAWEQVQRNARRYYTAFDKWEYGTPEVKQAATQFGLRDLCTLEESGVSVARAQFMKIYDGVMSRVKEKNVLSESVKLLPQKRLLELSENLGQAKMIENKGA